MLKARYYRWANGFMCRSIGTFITFVFSFLLYPRRSDGPTLITMFTHLQSYFGKSVLFCGVVFRKHAIKCTKYILQNWPSLQVCCIRSNTGQVCLKRWQLFSIACCVMVSFPNPDNSWWRINCRTGLEDSLEYCSHYDHYTRPQIHEQGFSCLSRFTACSDSLLVLVRLMEQFIPLRWLLASVHVGFGLASVFIPCIWDTKGIVLPFNYTLYWLYSSQFCLFSFFRISA